MAQPTHTPLLVVKATHAVDDPERANLACNIAAVGVAAGREVHLFLAADGVRLALPDIGELMPDVEHASPIGDLLDVVAGGGTITVCTPCATRRGLEAADLRAGVVMGGSAGFVDLATRVDATALVY